MLMTSSTLAGEVVDSTGDPVTANRTKRLPAFPRMLIGDVALDKVWVHADNNVAKIERLLQDEKGAVVATAVPSWLKLPVHAADNVRRDLPFYLLESSTSTNRDGVKVAERESHVANKPAKGVGDGVAAASELASLIQSYNIEPLWQYVARSRRTTNILRQDGAPIPP